MDKIKEAQEILKSFDLPNEYQGKISALTFLALCNIRPNDAWEKAERHSLRLSKDIMTFISINYGIEYKPNTRESFRKNALKPFLLYNVIELNPDDPNLPTNSSSTHYAISYIVLNTVKKI